MIVGKFIKRLTVWKSDEGVCACDVAILHTDKGLISLLGKSRVVYPCPRYNLTSYLRENRYAVG